MQDTSRSGNSIRTAVAAVLVIMAVASRPLHAYELWTSALSIDGGNDLHCRITNVTDSAQRVRAFSLDAEGSVISDSGPRILPPHGSAVLTNDDSTTGAVVCRFIVSRRQAVRASAQHTESPRGAIAAMPAE